MTLLGLDIGGANLKAADGNGFARTEPFALWKAPANLAGALQRLITRSPRAERLAVTMTGELADCFTSKAEGVSHILDAIDQIAETRPVQVYLSNGDLVDPAAARHAPLLAAASNWHVLARFASRFPTPSSTRGDPSAAALILPIRHTTLRYGPSSLPES